MSNSRVITAGGSLGAAGGNVTLSPGGLPLVSVEISGTFSQTLQINESINGANFVAAQVYNAAGASVPAVITAPGRYFVEAGGRSTIQVAQTAYTSGTANVVMAAGFGGIGVGTSDTVSGTLNQGTPNAAGTAAWPVQGAAAAGSALAGNPVVVAGVDAGGLAQVLSVLKDGESPGVGSSRGIYIGGKSGAGGISFPHAIQLPVDGAAATYSGMCTFAPAYVFNGTTFDRVRNNIDVTLLSPASRTTTQTSADIVTYNCQGIIVTLDVTAITSTCSLTVTINYKDPASGKYVNLLTSAVITAVSTTMLMVDPRIAAAANLTAQKDIGRTLQIVVTSGNGNSQTYSVGYTLIPG